ncbi:hypothetical protein [Geodermatophilus sp. SYSU D01119]
MSFSMLPLFSLVSSLLVLPLISSRFGAAGWSSLLLGQSIGAAVSVVASLSWPFEGPHRVATREPRERRALYSSSLRQRVLALLALTPAMVAVAVLVTPQERTTAVLSAVAIAMNALTPTWFFVGVSQPRNAVLCEGVTRLVAQVVGLLVLLVAPLWAYPVCLVAGGLASLVVAHRLLPAGDPAVVLPRSPWRDEVFAAVARGGDAAYNYLAGLLVALVSFPAFGVFGPVQQVNVMAANVLTSLNFGLVSWTGGTGSTGGDGTARRLRIVLGSVLVLGLLLLVGTWLLLPLVLSLLFAGTVELSGAQAGVAAVLIAASYVYRSVLLVVWVPLGRAVPAYRLTLVGAVVGLSGVAAGAWSAAGTGSLAGAAVATACGATVGIVSAALWLRRLPAAGQPGTPEGALGGAVEPGPR